MPKMVCVKCEVELKPRTNGVLIQEMFQNNTKTYKLWMADLWQCPKCLTQIVAGFANHPLMEHFQGDIESEVQRRRDLGYTIIKDNE